MAWAICDTFFLIDKILKPLNTIYLRFLIRHQDINLVDIDLFHHQRPVAHLGFTYVGGTKYLSNTFLG